MKKSEFYAILGFLIGWGAPLGAMALRYLTQSPSCPLYEFVNREWEAYPFFYWYMLVGTCLAFTFMGVILGRHEDRNSERNLEKVGS